MNKNTVPKVGLSIVIGATIGIFVGSYINQLAISIACGAGLGIVVGAIISLNIKKK